MQRLLKIGMAGMLTFSGLFAFDIAFAVESPTSYGEVARVDTPILRIPQMRKTPVIDGVMDEGEWEDSASATGFWYDYSQASFVYLAPQQTQLQIYSGFDKENLYICYSSPVYPENSWLRARGRFPDVTHHPQYGLIWDDHIELELRPCENNAEGFRLGLFKWFVNPFDTMADLHWSVDGGEQNRWQSKAVIRSGVTGTRWTMEIAIPLKSMVYGNYAGKGDDGKPIVTLPPVDGTAYRCWFVRGIGGNSKFFNVFDKHVWNTTKTKLVFDSASPVVQINELGPIMEDIIDVKITLKNHNTRSETVRLGFFVESQEGLVYSSYDAPELNEGLVELRPGEVKKLRLRRPFPGISRDGNTLWFDVRSAGRPAKILFRTRLIDFHSMDGGVVLKGEDRIAFKRRRLDVIESMRPPRRDFEFSYEFSSYTKKLQGIVDTGIHGASEDAKRAVEAKLTLMKHDEKGTVIASKTTPFKGEFACIVLDVPQFENEQEYKISLLLFDKNKRIVGERNPEPFTYEKWEWQENQNGLEDRVWDPFIPIQKTPDGFETLKHTFAVSESGLPAQISIKPDMREMPLEKRATSDSLTPSELLEMGRGPQLRGPFRLEVISGGKRTGETIVKPAALVRQWKSEHEYVSSLKVGPLDVALKTQYDCDGAMQCELTYGSAKSVDIDGFEMVVDIAGLVDLKASGAKGGGMPGADVWECGIPNQVGVVWDSADMECPDLYYSHFMPWLWFGSGDRAFTWFADSDKDWIIGRDGSSMTLERNAKGDLTWRVKFVSQKAKISGNRTIKFTVLTHPSKPKPEHFRQLAWFWRGGVWADEYFGGDFSKEDELLKSKARSMMTYCENRDADAIKDITDDEIQKWGPTGPLYWRYYQNKGSGNIPPRRFDTENMTEEEKAKARWDELKRRGMGVDRYFEDKIAYWFERHVRIGRRHGWWWDETWPVYRSSSLVEGAAYLRDSGDVKEDELPWQDGFTTGTMRSAFKRLSRIMAQNKVPNRNYLWANNEATCYESFAYDCSLVEECGGTHRTYDVDMLQMFPNSLYRRMAHNWSGLITRLAPEAPENIPSGDNPRLIREFIGIPLLHDIGLSMTGPHGQIWEKEEILPLLHWLHEFGFFKDQGMEMIPFWRTADLVGWGQGKKAEKRADSILAGMAGNVEVTVYRRALDDGRKGYKSLFVIMNETDADVELPLKLLNAERLLGGKNTLTAGQVLAQTDVPEALQAWWGSVAARGADEIVLMDVESGDVVAGANGASSTYGPVYVPYHSFRLLYAEHAEKL